LSGHLYPWTMNSLSSVWK